MSEHDSMSTGVAPVSTTAPSTGAPTSEQEPAPQGRSGSGDSADDSAGGSAGDGATPRPAGSGAPRKRRRGSRGGRNRKRPAAARAQTRAEDWTDPAADRGLTAEDLADQAREDAGLSEDRDGESPVPSPAKPRVGDARPAPPAPKPSIGDSRPAANREGAGEGGGDAGTGEPGTAPKRRRRRRGGRGRGRGTGGGTGNSGNGGSGTGGSAPGNGAGSTQRRSSAATAERPKPGFVEGSLDVEDIDGTAILDSLDKETLQRRRGRLRKGRPAGRYLMVVHVNPEGPTQIAVLEGRSLVEHYVSQPEDDTMSIDGNIYVGRVQNVLPGMEAAFIDISTPKNGVLYRGDVAYDDSDVEGKERPRIERMLRNGQSVIVQVTKNPIGHKGARLTQEVSLAGRFVVMVPGQPGTYGISKRLPDDERRRLRKILDGLRPPDAGLIVRTAAEGATYEELELDMRRLKAQWTQISDLAKTSKAARLLYKEPPLVQRVIREEFTKEYRGVVIDDAALYEEVRAYVDAVAPELAERVELFDPVEENLSIFERFHVHEQLHKALERKVWLPSGGSLVIERTEALTVVDVNTGKNVGRSNLEETVTKNNIEAAEAVARELRLRDIGGIIVIDFIDMESKRNREDVERALRDALSRDKTRTQIFPISELGLVEMTRKRVSEGLVEAFSDTCETCGGRGFVLDGSMLE
ncbi:MAG: Rne/Rng family ribonuclease [Acidimicrobiia bacterium]|nr:Rne/Rng family ribonuclease [Acidimicrobiia bacterium]